MQGWERVIHSPTIPTYRQKEEKRTKFNRRRQKGIEQHRQIKKYWPCSWYPPVPHHRIQGQQDRSTGTLKWKLRFYGTAKFFSEESNKYIDASIHTGQEEQDKEGASGYIWSYTVYTCSTATNLRWVMPHSNTNQIRNRAPLTSRSQQ